MEKAKILTELQSIVSRRIEAAKAEIASINHSKANETKSSAGDKYETGMAMLQIEEQKANVQLAKANELKQALSLIDPTEKHDEIKLGSWVETSNGNYFLSIGLGQIVLEDEAIYVLSMGSPIGQQLRGKERGDYFSFQGKEIKILYIQ